MPPTALLITGRNDFGAEPETIDELPTGWRGLRDFWCNTDDSFAALNSLGLPIKGQPWNLAAPNLKVVSRSARFVGGTADTATLLGGVCVVRTVYETPGLNGRLPPPVIGDRHTIVVPSIASLSVYYDWRLETIQASPFTVPINNGRGTVKTIGTTQARVVTYPASADVLRLMTLQREQNLNNGPVSLPPTRFSNGGAGLVLNFAAKQLRYAMFEIGDNAGLLELTQSLEMAPDHDVLWQREDKNGDAVAGLPPVRSEIYKPASFSGLW